MDSNARLSILNPRPQRLEGPRLLHDLVSKPCDKIALEHLSQDHVSSMSYADFHREAECLAARIATFNDQTQRQIIVPILLHQSCHLYIVLLAVLRAGGAFCPLNIDAPPERIKFILGDVDAKLVITTTDLAASIPETTGVHILCIDQAHNGNPTANIPRKVSTPDDLAYVMYTSGSTGTPKGVGISHHAATQALIAHGRHIPQFSRFLQFAAPTFDVSVFEIFFPLCRGCTLISARRQELLDDLPAVLNRMGVDACELTPTVAASLLRKRSNAPQLKLLLTIGEMLNAKVVEEFGGNDTQESLLWAMYGPTEATIHCTLKTSFRTTYSTRNIGIPLDTVSCFIIEPESERTSTTEFKLLPLGEVGELAVGGEQLATEYLNNHDKTKSVFIVSPFGRVYRTGDKARISEDGTIECFGRIVDGQVKLRGQRIELGEVEHAALRVSGCHGAVASIVGSILVLFAATDPEVSEDDIVESCRAWLPRFMIPGETVLMREFPRLPSGKANTKALKEMFEQQRASDLSESAQADGPGTELLRLVSGYLGQQLQRQTVLSAAGVDSLTAIELASFLRDAGYETNTISILTMRTVGDLLDTVVEKTASDPARNTNISMIDTMHHMVAELDVLKRDGRSVRDILPCTALQLAILSESARDLHAYWNSIELELQTALSCDDILKAFQTLCQENEILRTGFVQYEAQFHAVVFDGIHEESSAVVAALQDHRSGSADVHMLRPFDVQIMQSQTPGIKYALIHIHHAIYDGWSMDLLVADLSRLLEGETLPKRPQFRDLIAFQKSVLNREYEDPAKLFWAEYLFAWSKPALPKLASHLGPPGQIETTTLQSQLHREKLQLSSSENGVGPQVYFQAAVALAWSGILGTSDIVFGSVTSGRTLPVDGIENILGPFISSMPLRVDVDVTTVSELLNRISTNNRKIVEHSSLSLLEMKKLLGLRTTEQLYDVLFVYQDSPEQRKMKKKPVRETSHVDHLETKLVIEVQPADSTFTFQATHHSTHFPAEFARTLLQQVDHIVQNIVDTPLQTVHAAKCALGLPLSMYNFETIMSDEGCHADLAELFEEATRMYPNHYAVSFASSFDVPNSSFEKLTYREMNTQANQLAHFLLSNGANPGDVVAIVLPKSTLLYVAILGIIKAKCAYLPLLPSTPPPRIAEIFRQSNPILVLTDAQISQNLPQAAGIISLDNVQLQGFSSENVALSADLARLAYAIYTSGTTGVPKGVAVTQENIVNNVTYLGSIYPVDSAEPKLLQACSQAFDVSVFEIFYAWHKGMCLCTAPNEVLFEDIEESIQLFQITHLSLTPTVAALIDPSKVPTVEFLVTAGEPMTKAIYDSWGSKLWQGYGPSETTNICSVKHMAGANEFIEHLGWVFPNTSVAVLFPDSSTTVPTGWVGEFCFGGKQVAQEYLNMPQLTAEKFINHPSYGRIYRSGDMGRMLPDGSLIILGRIDDQIKLRGLRIEAAEVNSVVTNTPFASSAVTLLAKRDKHLNDQLVTFYVEAISDEAFDVTEVNPNTNGALFAELLARVPSYMVPSYLIPISCIPLTPSGKIDKRSLQGAFERLSSDALECATYGAHEEDFQEWTELERSIASSVASSLSITAETIRRWTSFTVLGLDSISAIPVAQKLGSDLGRAVSVSTLLQYSAVAQLAQHIDCEEERPQRDRTRQYFESSFLDSVQNTFHESAKKVVNIFPCSPLQEAMLSRGKHSYYNKILLRIRVSPEQMRSYWDTMTERHSILRTCFTSTSQADYPIAQVVLDSWNLPWQEFDVTQPSLDDAIDSHLKSVPEPLDTMLPPLSLALIRYRGSNFLSFICHHALYDGVAMECLWREVEALAKLQTLSPAIPYEPFLHEVLDLPKDVESFWIQKFRDFEPMPLFETGLKNGMGQITHTTSIPGSLQRIQEQMRNLGISLLSVCQVSWARVLNVLCQNGDVCFGNVVNGRTVGIQGIERLVAPCFNTIPIRQDLSGNVQNVEAARTFQKLNIELLQYQFTPLRLVQKLVPTGRRSLFDTLLLVQQPLQAMDKSVWTLEEDSGDMDIPLVCEIIPCPGLDSVVVNIHHDMSSVSTNLSAGIAELFKHIFSETLSSPYFVTDRGTMPTSLLEGVGDFKLPRVKTQRMDQDPGNEEDLPWTDEEEMVRKVLSTLSGTKLRAITKSMSIFHLGLDSINAVQVASMLRQKNCAISASEVVECQTSKRIASRIIENGRRQKKPEANYDFAAFEAEVLPQISERIPNGTTLYPCTPVQCAMIASSMSSNGTSYINALSFEMSAGMDATTVVRGWSTVAGKLPMLRTGFAEVRHPHSSFAMVQHGTISVPDNLVTVHASETFHLPDWKNREAKAILAMLYEPAWRVAIVQETGALVMHLLVHHSLYDAQSLDEILASLETALCGEVVEAGGNIQNGLSTMMQDVISCHDDATSFWKQQAENAVFNNFPVMTPLRENTRSVQAKESISGLSFSALQKSTSQLGVSVQAAIQASWCRVLASYLGETSVSFGVTLSGRTSESTMHTSVPCIVTLPVIARNYASNKEHLNQMMEYVTKMHKFRNLPLAAIQKALGHPGSSVFDTLVAYQKANRQSDRKCWTQVRDDATVEYPVSIEVEPQANGEIVLRLTYVDDVLPPEQASLLLAQFDVVLQHLVLHPEGSEDDMHKQNSAVFSITPAKVPNMAAPVRYLHEFVEHRAVSDKDKIALEHVKSFENGKAVCATWTFGELDEIGNRVANMLRTFTKPNSIIAIHFDKCPEAYFAILGILKSGSSFVALDPNAPSARKEFILQDSNAPCLLTDMTTSIEFDVSCPIIKFDEVSIQEYSSAKCEVKELTTDSTCYCLYTSGTTGTPKGCEITHENTVQCMMAFQDLFKGHWTDESRWLQFAALHFDVSVLEQYWSWSVGMTVVAARKDMILDDLLGFINALQITHIDLTPSLARLTHPYTVPTLCKGIFITGGEQLKQEILDAWGPQSVIYNAYGPTEATIGVTMYKRVPQNGRPSNIGQQFPNVGSYVFRQGTEIPVLRGGVGELCVSGKLVGKGYLNRPELTDDRFPTLEVFRERIYRTGDLVRILHDGCFEFLGRADDQVKLRGQRLEIGEIDHVIRSLPCIHDGTTIVTKHASSGKDVLVAFVVGEESKNTSLSILPDTTGLGSEARNACREKLPGYMVPSYFLRLPFIPLSPNNKAEAKVLKALFGDLTQEDLSKFSASSGPINNRNNSHLKELIESVAEFCSISASSISHSTSIFDIGIDSISALQLSSFLKQNGFAMTAPALVLKNPILGDLSTALSAIQSKDSSPSIRRAKQMMQAAAHKHRAAICRTLAISTDQIVSLQPCSSLQQGIIAKAMTGSEEGAYFNSFQMLLHPDASIKSLKYAWETLARNVPILRNVFVNTADGYMQVTTKQTSLPWSEHTLTKHDDFNVFMKERGREWISANEDIISEPLQILHVEYEKTRRLVIHIFHAVYDGGSFDLIMRNIQRLYDGKKIVQGPTFADTLAHGPLCDHTGARGGWVEHLANWRSALLSIGPASEGDHGSAISATAIIEPGDIESVRQKHNLTIQSVLLALWTATLQKYSATALTTGVIVSGRTINLNGVQDTIGPLFNTLPFFSGNLDTQTWPELLKRCQRFNGLVLEDPHVPLQDIQKWCSGGKQLFDNLFTYQVEDVGTSSTVPWTVEDVPSTPDYPLAFEVTKLADGKLRLHLVAQAGNSTTQLLEQIVGEFNANITLMQGHGNLPTAVGPSLQSSEANGDRRVVSREDPEFEWTAETLVVRQELASLANVTESDISPSLSILELGLDSIDVIQLTSRLRSKGIMIPASQIMKAQTISGISGRIEATPQQNQHRDGGEKLRRLQEQLTTCVAKEGIALDTVESVLPPTPLQEAMVSGMMQSDFNWYFNHEVLEIADSIDIEKLKLAWRTTIKNSPILRTGFVEVSDLSLDMSYVQVVYKQENFTIEMAELKSTSEFRTIIEKANQKARASNGKDHLVQLTFVMVESKAFVIFSIAHALYDGWSLSLIHQDLQNAYNNSMWERPLPDSFIVRSMESWTPGAEQFWANYLDSAHTTTVAQQHSPGEPVHRTTKRSCKSLFEVNTFCKRQNISLQALLQACWAALLAHRTNTLDVLFGAVLSGRDFDGAEDLLFPTMNTVAVRCILHGTVGSFLRYVEGNLADIREYQSFPLRKARAAAKLDGEFFDSLFLLQKAPASNDLQRLFKSVDGSAAVDYPVCVEAEPIGDELRWTTACQRQVESKALSEALVDQLDNVLLYLITHEDEDVVAFGESKVSISGLPYISLQDDKNKASETPSQSELAWNETAFSIRATLSSVSNVPEESIQISSTLYHLGLDSITAIKVSSLLKRKQLIIKPTELVRATSIGEMAEIIDKSSHSERGNETGELVVWNPPSNIDVDAILHRAGISQEDIEMVLPATPMQVHMTTVWQNTEGKVFYPTFWYRLTKPYAISDVEAAWEVTTQYHALLRTCLVTTGDEYVPILQAVFKKYMSPSSESAKPLAQLTVHHDGDSSTLLCLHIHHALYDGVSLPAIMETLSRYLSSHKDTQDEDIIPWSNYSICMHSITAKERRRAFWSQYLSDISTSGNEGSASASASRTSLLQRRALEDLRFLESGTSHGISIQAVAFAAFARSLAKSNTVIFGIYLANRATNADIPTSFPTLNLVPLKVNVSPGKSLLDVARQIQGDIQRISADGNADVGLWEIFSWAGVKISHFVNFLSLPDSTDDDSFLVPCEDGQQHEVAASPIPTAENNAVRHAYPASMDVEMSVKNGALDIGVFGPSSLVTDAEARDLVRSITSHLEA